MLKRVISKILSIIDKDYELKQLKKHGAIIGKNFWFKGSYIDPGFPFLIEIGDDVTLSRCTLLAHDGSTQKCVGKSKVAKIRIGNNVFVGYNSIVLPGVTVGDNVIIGAGSVVNHSIPSGSVAVGNPCRVIGTYDEFKEKHENYMLDHPVYPTYHAYKSKEEIAKMIKELNDNWGYDE